MSLRPEPSPVNQEEPIRILGIDNKQPAKKFKRPNLWRGRSAAITNSNNIRSILTVSQQKECIDAYTNDAIIRRCIKTLIMGIKGKRVKQTVEANEEALEGLQDEEVRQLQEDIAGNKGTERILELRQKLVRCAKRVSFNERLNTILTSMFVTGRGLLEIKRFPISDDWPIYGEPRSLIPLNTINITQPIVNETTGELAGLEYDDGQSATKRIIRPLDMIFAVNDDDNLYNYSSYSGISPVWTCLSVSQSNLVINDEDIPEAARQVAQKFGFLYTGTSRAAVTETIREQLSNSTWLIHNQEKLKPEVYDLARDLTELPTVRQMNAKYITWALMIPTFLIDDDTSTYATASQSIQAWKVTVVDYYRTLTQGFLEKYWYDPILADHLQVPVEDVISQRIKIKPVFEDLIFDAYKDEVDAITALVNAGVYTDEMALEKLGEDKFLQIKRELNKEIEAQREEDINTQMELINAGRQQEIVDKQKAQQNAITKNVQKNRPFT